MNGRVAAVALVVAIGTYAGWIAAVADDYEGTSIWTTLTAAVFWVAVLVLLAYVVTVIVRRTRRRR